MSKSTKRTPVSTWCCCKSQKRGKQICHRKFRRKERMLILQEKWEGIPFRLREVVDPWDLGGDGKVFWCLAHTDDRLVKLMRK